MRFNDSITLITVTPVIDSTGNKTKQKTITRIETKPAHIALMSVEKVSRLEGFKVGETYRVFVKGNPFLTGSQVELSGINGTFTVESHTINRVKNSMVVKKNA